MQTLIFYTLAQDGFAQVPQHIEAHRTRLTQFKEQGSLVMAGPYGTPPKGALAIFNSRDAALAFVEGDPFVINGIVDHWYVEDFHEFSCPNASIN